MNLKRRHFLQTSLLALCLKEASEAYASPPPPHSAFNERSTAEEVTDSLNLSGKTIVVTGCNSGIGLETMRVLALRGAHVIGTARTLKKAQDACDGIRGRTTPVVLELTDFDSIVACANDIRSKANSLDALICNAGIVLNQLEQVRGLEKQFVVNHLGHFILVNRLLDPIKRAPQGRIVVVGSGDHKRAPAGGIQFDRLSGEGWYAKGYAHSKLANGLFSLELSKRLQGTRATSNCVTPGHVRTNILRNVGNKYRSHAKTLAQGAATPCYVASNPALNQVSGAYFKDCNPAEPSPLQTDEAMAARLWKISEELTHAYLL